MRKSLSKKRVWNVVLIFMTLVSVIGIYSKIISVDAQGAADRIDYSSSPAEYVDRFCDFSMRNTNEIYKQYVKATNDLFNANIKLMAKTNDNPLPPNLMDFDKSENKKLCNEGTKNSSCAMLALCKGNFSSYCVGINAAGIPSTIAGTINIDVLNENFKYLKKSYTCFEKAMKAQKENVSELRTKDVTANCQYADFRNRYEKLCLKNDELAKTENDEIRKKLYSEIQEMAFETDVAYELVNFTKESVLRNNEIENSILKARKALMFTVEAYSELKSAWRKHLIYKEIFENLVKYKDYLVDIRAEVETFPLRFIDASTTQCL